MKKYFCCCDNCGGLDWMDFNQEDEEILNFLEENGEVSYEQDVEDANDELLCSDCEKPLKPILFSEVSKSWRIKLYKMKPEERIGWTNNFWTIKKLKEINEDEKESYY